MHKSPSKNIIQIYLPALINLLGDDQKFSWKKIDKLINRIINNRIEKYGNETITVNATIFDVMIAAQKGTKEAIMQLEFLNLLFNDLNQLLNEKEKSLIRSIIENILKSPNNNYINFVGEIGALVNLMSTGLYRLENVEYPLESGKSIDFQLRKIDTNELVLAEIVSIRLDPDKVINDKDEMETFISKRIDQKINSKDNQNTNRKFFLIPIILGPSTCLKIYSDFFKNYKIEVDYVIEPLAFLSFHIDQNEYLHKFSRISKLFDIDSESIDESAKTYKEE